SRITLESSSAVRGSSSANGRKSRPRCWEWTGTIHSDPPGSRSHWITMLFRIYHLVDVIASGDNLTKRGVFCDVSRRQCPKRPAVALPVLERRHVGADHTRDQRAESEVAAFAETRRQRHGPIRKERLFLAERPAGNGEHTLVPQAL